MKDEIDVKKDSVDITMENEQDETSTLPVTVSQNSLLLAIFLSVNFNLFYTIFLFLEH